MSIDLKGWRLKNPNPKVCKSALKLECPVANLSTLLHAEGRLETWVNAWEFEFPEEVEALVNRMRLTGFPEEEIETFRRESEGLLAEAHRNEVLWQIESVWE